MEADGFYKSENTQEDEKAYIESYNYARPFLAVVIVVGFVTFLGVVALGTAIVNAIFNLITK